MPPWCLRRCRRRCVQLAGTRLRAVPRYGAREPGGRREGGALAADVVGLDEGREHGEAGLCVERALVAVLVDARDLDLVTGPRDVDEIVEQDDILAARQPPRWHAARRLLHATHPRCVYCPLVHGSRDCPEIAYACIRLKGP